MLKSVDKSNSKIIKEDLADVGCSLEIECNMEMVASNLHKESIPINNAEVVSFDSHSDA